MPLTRGRVLGYDNERMAFRFSMLDGGTRSSSVRLARRQSTHSLADRGVYADRDTQFSQLRETNLKSCI